MGKAQGALRLDNSGGIRVKRRLLLALVLVLTTVALVGCGTAVPDVKGMTVAQARDGLNAAGFTAGSVTYDEKAQGAQGAVVVQAPAAGESAKSGSMVALTVAGAAPVPTPDLSGLDKAKAEAALVAGGLVLGTVTESYDASIPVGVVTSQTPAPRAESPRGSSVTVVVSKGAEPVSVPSVKGKTQKEAQSILVAAGFKVKVVTKSSSAKKGTVSAQSPSGGKAQVGSVVTITVSTGVEMVRVPNIQGMMNPDPVLQRVGLKPHGVAIHGPIESDAIGIGLAYRQRPRAGTLVPKGTTVTYHYWWEAG